MWAFHRVMALRPSSLRLITVFAVGFGACTCAMAPDDVPMPTKALTTKPAPIIDIWTFSATPYAWATMMNGSVTVKGRTADINVDLNDLWNLAKQSEIPKELFAFMGSFEARYDRFSIFSDFYIYSRPMQPVLPAGSCPLRSEATELVRVNEMTQRAWEPTFGSRIRSLHPVFFLGMVRTI